MELLPLHTLLGPRVLRIPGCRFDVSWEERRAAKILTFEVEVDALEFRMFTRWLE
jgi:hypothetical protein